MTMTQDRNPLVTLLLSFVLAIGACAGASDRASDPVYDPRGMPAGVTHDEAREAHMGPPALGDHYQGSGVRNAGDETPEWWGRGDRPTSDDEDPSTLSGPLLLQSDRPTDAADDDDLVDAADDDDPVDAADDVDGD